ncbi:MAG: D-alanine--D-alanine ligase [Devosia sp.]
MLIGLTYDLREDYLKAGFTDEQAGEFDVIETIDAVETALRQHGHEVERIGGIKALVPALAAGKSWPLVWNMCEGVHGIAREAQVPALLEAYSIPFVFSTAEILATAMDKGVAKLVVAAAGVPTPAFTVVRSARDLVAVKLAYPLFVKPLAEGTSKGVHESSKVADRAQLTAKCLEVLKTFHQPALVETFLPGREFTVGLIASGANARVIGVSEIHFLPGGDPSAYSYKNKMEAFDELTLATGPLADEVASVALAAWRALGCRDGGRVDIRCDADGHPSFMECNPLAGMRPRWSELVQLAALVGIDYDTLIGLILEEALARVTQ